MEKIDSKLDSMKKKLQDQHYYVAGDNSAIKICSWTKKSLKDEGFCYKQKFYGIRAHLCCQMSPSVGYCPNRCLICWRDMEYTFGNTVPDDCDDPKEIIENCIKGQRVLLSGHGGDDNVNKDKFKEAQEPMHFAISLTGEPTAYPKLNQLIKELHKLGKTTFVVTNGMNPDKLENIEPPTQLYLSVDAPNEELFKEIDNCTLDDGWQRLNHSLDAIKKLKTKTRTTLRFTLIKELNMIHPEQWAAIIKKSEPLFIEVKAYMYVGSSRERLEIENMPRHPEVKEFAEQICKHCDYQILDEKEESRVVLLAKEDFPGRIMVFD